MIESLNIKISKYDEFDLKEEDKIIIVDGCKGNSNVEELCAEEIAVIDHHDVEEPASVKYVDIRREYGACSTIIFSYYQELNKNIPRDVATALIIGLNMDTANFTRGVSEDDVIAFYTLYLKSDINLVSSVLRNHIKVQELNFYRVLFDKIKIESEVAFCYFQNGCNQNLLGILGDFLLSLEEVNFVILCAKNNGIINFSIRSEKSELNAATIIKEVLRGIGYGGGHSDMAGGVIKDLSKFDEEKIYDLFVETLDIQ
jgi:nanoRNase/pAp phosphatase (c-di-AMP/oligoRNAs hydrolase)